MYAQGVEIKKLYSDEYDVFIHAQASPWLVISHLVKELWKAKNPEANLHHFKALRAPCETARPQGIIESVYQFLYPTDEKTGIGKYRDRSLQWFTLSDNDAKVREELLSVDAFFTNHARFESALHFLTNNVNILENKELIEGVATKAIGHFYPKVPSDQKAFYARRVIQAIERQSFPCGNLFVICIPKKEKDIRYRAHPFGLSCGCHDKTPEREILDKLQEGVLDQSTKCQSILAPPVPQYRLFLPKLKPGTGKKVFLLSPLAHHERQAIKGQIRNVISEIKTA